MSSAMVWHQTLAAVPIVYHEFSIGLAFGWTAPTIKSLERTNSTSTIPLTLESATWIASLHELGRFVSPLLIIPLLGVIGRKSILSISAFLTFIVWFAVLCTKSILILYIVRFVFGIGLGMYDILSCIYLEENFEFGLRKTFYSIHKISFYVGLLVAFIISTYLPYNTVAIINLVNGFMVLLSTLLLRETVQFLLEKSRRADAQKNFMWLKGEKDWDVICTEFDTIDSSIREERCLKDTFADLFTKDNYKNVILAIFLNLVLVGIGHCAVIAYATYIFQNFHNISSNTFSIFFALVEIISVSVSCGVIKNRFNVQLILQLTLYGICVIHIWTSLLFYKNADVGYSWWIFLSIGCFAFTNSVLEPAINVITAELIPRSRKETGGCLVMMVKSAMGLLIIKTFLILSVYFGNHVCFTIFMIISMVAVFINYIVFPTTCLGDFM